MIVGALGDIVFSVSSNQVLTLDNFKWSGSARYATHARHGTNALTEFCGVNPDAITFDVLLSAYLGVNPMQELNKIWTYEREGRALSLVVGEKAYGKYRWTITKHSAIVKTTAGDGSVTSVSVSLTLQEYLRS